MAAGGVAALAGLRLPPNSQWIVLAAAAIVYLALIALIELRWRDHLRRGLS
ncbi:hypothetical protein D3C83_214580 [compost metagenome]